MKTIQAVYEEGVFKPIEPVDLPEFCRVTVEPESEEAEAERKAQAQKRIHEILSHRYASGDPYGAERHNEHQP